MQEVVEGQQQSVTVAIRIRPANAVAAKSGSHTPHHKLCLGVIPKANAIVVSKDDIQTLNIASSPAHGAVGGKKTFTFDQVHVSESSQKELYNSSCLNLVNQFVDGFNVTIFAYGQTSSGKTYTMGSSNNANTPEDEMGIIPRVVHQIMNLIDMKQKLDPNISYSIRCTFLEIYQEQVRDLLMPNNDAKDIQIREDRNGSITVSGVHEESVSCANDLFKCLEMGGIERTTGDTKMHMSSSRSHAVFTLILEQRLDTSRIVGMKTDEEDFGFTSPASSTASRLLRCSKLHLVDLAGSERVKRTGAEGVRLKESVKINSGLLALGNVISVLGEMHDPHSNHAITAIHVPYRDSKLTRLLQNSLGGNAKTLMLACVSPCEEDYEETLNTLKYADRARKIQNKPVINTIDFQAVKLASMQERIDYLEAQIRKQEEGKTSPFIESNTIVASSVSCVKEDALVDMDNDSLITYFVEELKNRTIRGTNAMKGLQDANNENQRLASRISDLEERLHTARLAVETFSQKEEKTHLTIHDLDTCNKSLLKDLNTTLDVLDALTNIGHDGPGSWKLVQSALGEEKWNAFSYVCESYRPNLVQLTRGNSTGDSSQFPVVTLPPVKPKSRVSSGLGARFNRRASKVVPDDTGPNIISPSLKELEEELLKTKEENQRMTRQLAEIQEEREIENGILNDKVKLIESLRNINVELEAKAMSLRSFEPLKCCADTQTEIPLIALAAEPVKSYQHLTNSELIEEITRVNQTLDLNKHSITQTHICQPMSQETLESIRQLSRLDEDESEYFPVRQANTNASAAAESAPNDEVKPETATDYIQLIAELQMAHKAKVELQRELIVKNKEMEKLKHQHLEKVVKLEKDLETASRELVRTTTELDEAVQAKEKLKDEYEKKLKMFDSQMSKAKTKMKDQEKLIKDKETVDRKLSETQQEIERLQAVISNAKKKAKDDLEKLNELENRRVKDVAALNRAREEDSKKIRQLEVAAELVRKKLDRKEEEFASLSKKMKDGLAVARMSKPTKPKASIAKTEVTGIEKELGEVESGNEILSVVTIDTTSFVQTLEAENERFRSYHAICVKIRDTKSKIDELATQINQLDQNTEQEKILLLKTERKSLAKDLVELREQRKSAEKMLDGNITFDGASTRPVTAESDEINYSALLEEFANNSEIIDLINHLKSANLHDSRSMVIGCLREIAELRELESTFEEESQRSQEEIELLSQQMEKLRISFERKLSKMQKEYESKLQAFDQHPDVASRIKEVIDFSMQTDPDPVIDTTNDVEFYKQTSKDLKLKLRELVALNHSLTKQLEIRPVSELSSRSSLPKDIAPAAL